MRTRGAVGVRRRTGHRTRWRQDRAVASTTARVLAVAQPTRGCACRPRRGAASRRKLASQRARDPATFALDPDAHVGWRRERERQGDSVLAAVAVRRERGGRHRHEPERAVDAQRDHLLHRQRRPPCARSRRRCSCRRRARCRRPSTVCCPAPVHTRSTTVATTPPIASVTSIAHVRRRRDPVGERRRVRLAVTVRADRLGLRGQRLDRERRGASARTQGPEGRTRPTPPRPSTGTEPPAIPAESHVQSTVGPATRAPRDLGAARAR